MKYSIITPVYNRADCIQRCMDSVFQNLTDGFEVEHIIVDDGSSDSTPELVESFATSHSYIKFIKFAQNKGTNAARNAAIKTATGDYCIILDSDDCFVKDALKIIHETLSQTAYQYKHYMFAPDDMVGIYKSNNLLKEETNVLTYEHFLGQKVSGDFIHVMTSSILKRHPFNEELRIYEGIFFLQFYKEANSILFTNKVVTIRERNRIDSVTRHTIRTKKEVINKNLQAVDIQIKWYKEDYIKYNLYEQLHSLYFLKVDNSLLLSKYNDIKPLLSYCHGIKGAFLKFVYWFKLGWLYRISLECYLIIYYNVFKCNLKQ